VDFWELTVILVRRWYVFLPVILLTLGVTYLLGQRVEPSYTAEASMLVAGPGGELGEGNPYADGTTAAQVLTVIMESPEAVASVSSQIESPVDVDYTVSRVPSSAILNIEADAPTAEAALQAANAVVSVIEFRLGEAQEAIGTNTQGRSNVLTLSPPLEPIPSTGDRARVLIAGGAVSGLLALAAALAVEGFQRRRRHPKVRLAGRRPRPDKAA
jgi:uncharacterized protein involved in exopolysaccharide biosynthesis